MFDEKRAEDASIQWLRLSAERGEASSQFILGRTYLEGKYLPKDEVKALYWLTKAAKQGDKEAILTLNILHAQGRVVLVLIQRLEQIAYRNIQEQNERARAAQRQAQATTTPTSKPASNHSTSTPRAASASSQTRSAQTQRAQKQSASKPMRSASNQGTSTQGAQSQSASNQSELATKPGISQAMIDTLTNEVVAHITALSKRKARPDEKRVTNKPSSTAQSASNQTRSAQTQRAQSQSASNQTQRTSNQSKPASTMQSASKVEIKVADFASLLEAAERGDKEAIAQIMALGKADADEKRVTSKATTTQSASTAQRRQKQNASSQNKAASTAQSASNQKRSAQTQRASSQNQATHHQTVNASEKRFSSTSSSTTPSASNQSASSQRAQTQGSQSYSSQYQRASTQPSHTDADEGPPFSKFLDAMKIFIGLSSLLIIITFVLVQVFPILKSVPDQVLARMDVKEAQYRLGLNYYYGEKGLPDSDSDAIFWLLSAADQGYVPAQYKVAQIYMRQYEKKGNYDDIEQAYYWYEMAAVQGHEDAQREKEALWAKLKKLAKTPKETPKAEDKALTKAKNASLVQHVQAEDEGLSEEDKKEGVAILRSMAEEGDAKAQFYMGAVYLKGYAVEQDEQQALDWFRRAALQGDAEGQFQTARILAFSEKLKQNKEEALYWFERAAEQGHKEATQYLAKLYLVGDGAEDEERALYWHQKLAEQGDKEAQELVRLMQQLEDLQGIAALIEQADAGDAEAQFKVATYFSYDHPEHDIGKMLDKALFYYQKAAENNHALAQRYLGEMLYQGEGVEKDDEEAIYWLAKSAVNGNTQAQRRTSEILSEIRSNSDWLHIQKVHEVACEQRFISACNLR